ncbi:hypothetical protein JW905_12140 [bacterium]|nr:hypothetical protein [candidate division CSSED10-310 bacterium]
MSGGFVLAAILVLAGTVQAHYCPVGFSYDEGFNPVDEVLVSGSFNGWASAPPDALAMTDDNGDGVWEVDTELDIGTYLYKFIVDGLWIEDPGNNDRSPDGYGGYNSVVHVECDYPRFEIATYHVDEAARRFRANVSLDQAGAALDPASVVVTLDHELAPAGSWSVTGNVVSIDIQPLDDGIHDIRVEGDDLAGRPVEMSLLKAYINETTDWHDAMLYFTMTDRFYNGDPGNDAPLPGLPWETNYQGGDFRGITEKIEAGYFDDLGVNAIWISWPGDNAESSGGGSYGDTDQCGLAPGQSGVNWIPVEFSAYHGYWPGDLYGVENKFGTMEELYELVDKAHARGIRILLDLVINHVHVDSPYFSGSPDYFFNYPMQICQDIGWSAPITCWFTAFLPDLNYQQPGVIRDMTAWASWWAKTTGCDGFRVDALKHVEFAFIQALRTRMEEEMEGTGIEFYMVGETFTGNPHEISPFLGDDLVQGQFDFPLNLQILKAYAWEEMGIGQVHQLGGEYFNIYGNNALMSTFLGNHDIARFLSAAAGSLYCPVWDSISHASQGWRNPPGQPSDYAGYQKLQLAFSYIMTLPGIPLIYYGDEIGMPGGGDPDNRRMMRFGQDLSSFEQQTLAYLRVLGGIRRDHPALRAASWPQTLWAEDNFLAYSRVCPMERAVVAVNRSSNSRQQTFSVSGTGLADGDMLTELIRGGTATVNNNSLTVNVPGRSVSIYSLFIATPTPTPTRPPGTPTPTPLPSGTVSPTPTQTPTSAYDRTIDVATNQGMYDAGDRFILFATLGNQGPAIIVDMYVVLDVYQNYYFYPSWGEELEYSVRNLLSNWTYDLILLDFIWPQVEFGAADITFWGAIIQHGGVDVLDLSSTSFGWR